MKVLLLNGSANKKGNTFTALTEIANRLEKNGVESEIMQLGNKPVRGCIVFQIVEFHKCIMIVCCRCAQGQPGHRWKGNLPQPGNPRY